MKKLLNILLTLVLLTAAASGLLWWMSQATPTWYAPPDPVDPQVAELADRVEYRLFEEAQKIRPEETLWTLVIRDEQVNAWLSTRLPSWVAHEATLEWPDQIGTPQVRFLNDGIHLAIPWEDEHGRPRYPVLRFRPAMTKDGRIALPLTGASLGRLPLPDAAVQELVGRITSAMDVSAESPSDETALVMSLLAGREVLDPVFGLADGRRVRVTGVSMARGMVQVTCRTVAERSP